MPITFEQALEFTLKWEGGYTNDKDDLGGATNKGIIQSVYNRYRRRKGLDIRSVKFLNENEMLEIYEKDYWNVVRAKYLKAPLGLVMFDTCVNFGPAGAIARLQIALNLKPTGTWTKNISGIIHTCDAGEVALKICKLRIAKRYARVKEEESQKKFLKGWLNRDNDLIKEVNKMIGANIMAFDDEIELDDIDLHKFNENYLSSEDFNSLEELDF